MSSKLKQAIVLAFSAPCAFAMGSAVAAGTVAGGAPKFFGGGATLPAIAYVGEQQATNTTNNPAKSPGYSAGGAGIVSAFGYFNNRLAINPNTKIWYCQTGSGAGKRVLSGVTNASGGAPANGECANLGLTAIGFGTNESGGNNQTYADFAGSDSPLSQSEFDAYVTNAGAGGTTFIDGRGQPVQLPAVVGGIALLYRNDGVTARLNLQADMVCKIFANRPNLDNNAATPSRTWGELGVNDPSTGQRSTKPIKVAYRTDGSGTTFAFANFLNTQCAAVATKNPDNAIDRWWVSQSFAEAFNGVGGGSVLPSSFIGGNGNPGVTTAVISNDGTIGYVEAANAKKVANASNSDGINFAKVNNKDPLTNLPEAAASIPLSALVTDKVLGSLTSTDTDGRPAVVDLTVPVGGTPGCVVLVNPEAYDVPTAGYPIIAVSSLLFSTKGNAAANLVDLARLGSFLTEADVYTGGAPTINTIDDATTTAGTGKRGYSSLPFSFNSIIASTATTCIGS
jgi:phosphate transport system substrate-binding protein